MNIRWFESIGIRIFLFVALIVTVSVGLASWQNLRFYRGLLSRQAEENLISSAEKSANSLHSNLLFWAATIHSTVRMGERLGGKLDEAVLSLLDANRDVVAFQLLTMKSGQIAQELFRFTGQASPEFRGASPESIRQVVRLAGQSFAREAEETRVTSSSLANLSGTSGAPLLQMRIRFERVGSGSDGIWAVLSFWPNSIYPLLQRGSNRMSAVLDSSGKTLLDSEGGVSSEFFAPVDPGKLGSLGREKLPFRSWNSRSKNSEPIFSTLHYLPEFRLNVLFQRVFVAEQREVGRQIRDLAFASWVLLLIALFVSFLVASRFSGRIRLLVDAVVAIARGDFSTSVPARTRDELGLLARAVNKMSHDIRELMRVREQAARQELELRTAETIQRSFFPKHRIADGRLRTSTYFRPASECAGDWWGHFDLGDGRQLVVIADAVGHGASSALLAAVAFSFFATLEQNPTMARELGYSPARMLQQLNRVLWNSGGSSMTITMAAMLFDFNSRSVRYASGGHVPVVRVSMWQNPKSSELELKAKSIPVSGNIVGFSETFEIVETSFPLVSGDWFILYTDGLFENQNGGGLSLSKRRFREFLEREAPLSVNGFLQATFDHVSGFFGQSELDDDVTMVVLEVSESFAGDTA